MFKRTYFINRSLFSFEPLYGQFDKMNSKMTKSTALKQSKIPHDFEIEEVHATRSNLINFKVFLKNLEAKYKHLGAVKIIPPKCFSSGFKEIPRNSKLTRIIKRQSNIVKSGSDYAYEVAFVNPEEKTFGEYYDQLKQKKIKNNLSNEEIKNIEDLTWKAVKNDKINLYSSDQHESLFSDSCQFGNLNKFTLTESFLHTKSIEFIEGIHTPYSYVGDIFTVFPLHIEDFDLYALNYLHLGYKFWYIIPGTELKKLEQLVNRLALDSGIACDNFLRHKSLMIPPSVLKANGIKFSRVTQKTNEFILIFSGGFHSGFNLGYNIAEAINVGADGWLENYPKFNLCNCKTPMNENYLRVRESLEEVYQREIKQRKNINSFKCDICSITVKTKKLMSRHMVLHLPSRNRFYCPVCSNSFSRERDAKNHFKNKHPNLSMPKEFETRSVDNPRPKGNKVSKKRKFTCRYPKCDKTVLSNYGLKRHMNKCRNKPI